MVAAGAKRPATALIGLVGLGLMSLAEWLRVGVFQHMGGMMLTPLGIGAKA